MKGLNPETPASWVEINLSNLKENYRSIRRKVKPSTQIMAVVKADAYGHGLIPVAKELVRLGVPALGVGSIAEGIQIREQISPTVKVILLLGCFQEETAACIHYRLTPVLYSLEVAERINRQARKDKIRVPIHLKIDTGMGRLGIPWDDFHSFLTRTASLENLKITGLTSHFGQADERKNYNLLQWERFTKALHMAPQAGVVLTENHMANSAALLNYRQSHLHYVRPGILLYGCNPTDPEGPTPKFKIKPVMSLKSRILQIKEVPPGVEVSYGGTYITTRTEVLAIIPIGYANGYSRILSNRSEVLIGGHRFPVIGRICMNLIVARVHKSLPVLPGQEVVLIGSQGQESITADTLALKAETIPYELFCLLGRMNPRKYLDN
jgi:alanine racemase